MIIKIGERLGGAAGLVRYLAGPGHGNEHENQRVVAGTVSYAGPMDSAMATQVAHDLQMPSQMHPDVKVKGGEIYHVMLSVGADEGRLPDWKWKAIAEDFMQGMGFDDPSKATMRWTAVNHGLSVEGNDHVHLVGNLIREDGTKVNVWKDFPKAQAEAARIEAKYGLKVLDTRGAKHGAGSVPYTAPEARRARETGQPIERLELERRIRAAAVASTTEAEFVRRVRADGLLIRPYPAAGEVTGYSVGLPAPPGQDQTFFQGGKLARDLSLPRLRAAWPDGGGTAAAATPEWRVGAPGAPAAKGGRETKPVAATPQAQAAVLQELEQLGAGLASMDPQEFAAASHDLSGVLAAGSRAIEGGRIGPIGQASRDVGAWAQTRRAPQKAGRRRPVGRGTALLLMQAMDPTGPMGQAVMYRQLIDMAMSIYQLHRASRPVAGVQGRSGRVSQGDGFDDTLEGLGTVAVTLAARAVQVRADEKRQAVEQENRPGVAREDVIEDRAYRAWIDAGGSPGEGISEAEFAGMSDAQRGQVAPKPDRPVRSKSPLDWVDAAAPVTGPQRHTLAQAGFTRDEITQLDKGHASLVIAAIGQGPDKARKVYEENTAVALITAPATPTQRPRQPVVSAPKGTHTRRV